MTEHSRQHDIDRVSMPALVIGGIGIVRNLGEEGVPVYTGSDVPHNHINHSRYVRKRIRFSCFSSKAFVQELIALGKAEGRKMMFFSDDDRAILTFAQHQEELRPYYLFNLPSAETVDAILDKGKFATLGQKLGLPVPWSYTPKSIDELKGIIDRVTYPCLIKPAHKEDWWGPAFREIFGSYTKAIECHNQDDLLDTFPQVLRVAPDPVLQELVEGDDSRLFSVNLYYDRDRNLRGFYAAQKHRTYPIHAGQGCLIETVKNQGIFETSRDVALKLGINGLCNIQYKKDPRGALKIMEIHVRNSVWSYLGKACGMNLYYMAYLDQQGYEYPYPRDYHAGVKFVDLKRDLRAILAYRKTGEWTIGRALRSLRGKRVYHIFNWRDPMPFVFDTFYELRERITGNKRNTENLDRIPVHEATEHAG